MGDVCPSNKNITQWCARGHTTVRVLQNTLVLRYISGKINYNLYVLEVYKVVVINLPDKFFKNPSDTT